MTKSIKIVLKKMDWIHCNKCFAQLSPGISLQLTSCGHMFCNNCLDKDILGVKDLTCIVCHMTCSVMKLVPDMNPDIEYYFTEPEDIVKKTCDVLEFQKQHRRRLMLYLMQSTKKFYAARTELRRMSEVCQKQHKQLKDYQKIIKALQAQLQNQPKQASPFSYPISPGENLSPNYIQSTPTYKRPAKSTPSNQQQYQSDLLTPTRMTKHRSSSNYSAHSQRSNASNKITSTVFSPQTPESAGFHPSQESNESGYSSNGFLSPSSLYCNGHEPKCSFRNKMKIAKYSYDV